MLAADVFDIVFIRASTFRLDLVVASCQLCVLMQLNHVIGKVTTQNRTCLHTVVEIFCIMRLMSGKSVCLQFFGLHQPSINKPVVCELKVVATVYLPFLSLL